MTEEISKKSALKKNFPLLLMLGLIGLGSLFLGLGTSFWLDSKTKLFGPSQAQATIYHDFLNASWNDPNGNAVQTPTWQGKVLVINFWASWCPPCVEEMPMLSALNQELDSNSVQMVGIGIDSPSNLRQFLEKTQVSYPVIVGGMSGSDWMKKLGNEQGALPYTIVIGPDGNSLFRKLGKVAKSDIENVLNALNKPSPK